MKESILIVILFLKSKVKENGGMASCSALLGSPPALGKIDFTLSSIQWPLTPFYINF